MNIPPQRLSAPPAWARYILTPIWAALLLFALVAQLGGMSKLIANYFIYNPPYNELGLIGGNGQYVSGSHGVAKTHDIPPFSLLSSIDGTEIPDEASREQVSQLLAEAPGPIVRVTMLDAPDFEQSRTLELTRSAANAQAVEPGWVAILQRIVLPMLSAIAAGFCLLVSVLLWRRSSDAVAQVLAIGLVGLVLAGDEMEEFLVWVFPSLDVTLVLIGIVVTQVVTTCLVLAAPTFPDNVFRPKWSGWLGLLAPAVAAFIVGTAVVAVIFDSDDEGWPPVVEHVVWINSFLLLVAIVAAWRRFRATPAGRERQQVKWAALGIVLGIAIIQLSYYVDLLIPDAVYVLPGMSAFPPAVRAAGMVILPLGILMSVMGWRLNDADGAIGRTAGYALITLLVGGIWAALTSWLNKAIGDYVPVSATAGISTMIAAAVLVPARERILKWTERKFQPALVRLRGLPAKLQPWRSDHSPEDIAAGALTAIVKGLNASSAAIVLTDPAGHRVLALHGTDESAVLTDLTRDDPDEWTFPVHFKLSDLMGDVGMLLLGRRSDGAYYNSDERGAIKLVAAPLAEVLRATSRRAERNAVLAQKLDAVDERVARLEMAAPR